MKYAVPIIALLVASFSLPALSQPIESEPLPPQVPYTLKNETDPMALGSAPSDAAPLQTPAQSGDFAPLPSDTQTTIAPPPPAGAVEVAPEPTPVPAESFPPAPAASPDSPAPFYPNNAVSGLPPQDNSKFENRIFCTLKISFGSIAAGPDRKTADKVKAFLDERAGKLSYVRSDGEGKEGEFSYCVTIEQHNLKAETYTSLKSLLKNADVTAPVHISGKGFTPFTAGGRDYRN